MRARPLDVRIGGPGLRVCAAHVSRKNPNIVSPRRVHGVVRGLCSSVGASCAGSIRGRPLRISRHQFWTQTIGLSMDRLCTVFCSLSLGRHHLDAALHRRNSHLSESSIFLHCIAECSTQTTKQVSFAQLSRESEEISPCRSSR